MALAVVRDLRPEFPLETSEEVVAFEQDLMAEFVLARASAGVLDDAIRGDVGHVLGLREWFGRPLREMEAHDLDLDRYFGQCRRDSASGTKVRQAAAFSVFFEFLELRHKAGIHAATGFVVDSPLDEMNRPRGGTSARLRIPPPEAEALARRCPRTPNGQDPSVLRRGRTHHGRGPGRRVPARR
ncbi:hypothetical protein AB0D97_28235 [Streptomyces roseus]|uniref:hypothetical protein n=1 Tax=Streptomyces roseus TaxID=66430 RepID=UPI0033EC65B6